MNPPLLFLGALLLAIFIAGAPAKSNDAAEETGLRVISANVRYGSAKDGPHSWDKRARFAVETLVAGKPDILGLQEALAYQVETISGAFEDHTVIGEGRDGGDRGEWSPLLVNTSRFAIRASGTFRLSPKDEVGAMGWDAACTRIATWAELSDRRAAGRSLLVINTHFDHVGKKARLKSAELLVAWGKRRQDARGQMPVILLGDLNAIEASPALTALKGAGLRDTFRSQHPETENVGTFHGFKGGRDGRRIDYVLAGEGWIIEESWIDWTVKEGKYPSDHRFVGAKLDWVP